MSRISLPCSSKIIHKSILDLTVHLGSCSRAQSDSEWKVNMTNQRMTEVKSVQQEPEREQRIFTFKITQLIWLFLGILEALIALRIGLKLIRSEEHTSELQSRVDI